MPKPTISKTIISHDSKQASKHARSFAHLLSGLLSVLFASLMTKLLAKTKRFACSKRITCSDGNSCAGFSCQLLKLIMVVLIFLSWNVAPTSLKAAELPADTLNSIMWKSVAKDYLLSDKDANGTIKMSQSVVVVAPKIAEDQLNVPVSVDATAIKNVKKIIVIADLNPLPKVLTYEPIKSQPRLSFRIKVGQATPVRAAVLDEDGVWYVGGTYINASGGGCSQPALAYKTDDWVSTLTQVRGKIWRKLGKETSTLRFSIRHPMDTGLADGIPAFYIEKLKFTDSKGNLVGKLTIHEPVSENPTITLYPQLQQAVEAIKIKGRDNEGNLIDASIPAPIEASLMGQSRINR